MNRKTLLGDPPTIRIAPQDSRHPDGLPDSPVHPSSILAGERPGGDRHAGPLLPPTPGHARPGPSSRQATTRTSPDGRTRTASLPHIHPT